LQAYELTNARIADFLLARQEAGYSNHLSRQGLEPILELLQTAGVVSALQQEPEASERDRLFHDYAEYLVQERGVVPMTVLKYESIARNFLSVCIGEDKLELSQLGASDVSSYIVRQSRQSSVNWTKYTVTALRSLLRFLYLRGELATDLVGAVGKVAAWRQTSLPKALPAEQVQRLLKSCDRRTHPGRRNFAVMLLLARFGLRAGEVAALELDDFHWAQGEVVIRGKGREDRLPLPCDVGEAVVAYIRRGRPQTSLRKLFLSNIAPLRAISGCAVSGIVRSLCANIPETLRPLKLV